MFLVSVVHSPQRSIFKITARVSSDLAGLCLFTKVTLVLWVTLVILFMRGAPELH